MAEKKRIIRVMFVKIKPAYYKLSEEEQQEFMRKDREKMEELGYKLHFMLDCSLSNKEWQFIGIEEWPSMEAIKKIEKFHEEELQASKYSEYKTYLCTPVYDAYTQSGSRINSKSTGEFSRDLLLQLPPFFGFGD